MIMKTFVTILLMAFALMAQQPAPSTNSTGMKSFGTTAVVTIPVYFEVNYGAVWKVETSYWHTVRSTNVSALYRIRMDIK